MDSSRPSPPSEADPAEGVEGPRRGAGAALAALRTASNEPSDLGDRLWAAVRARLAANPLVVVLAVTAALAVAVAAYAVVHRPTGVASGPAAGSDRGAYGSVGSSGSDPSSPGFTGDAAATPGSTAPALVVQAAGAVAHPGVFHLAAGSRVADLIRAAGGLAPDADADRIDQAAPLADGSSTYVPHLGQTDVPQPPAGSSDPGSGTAASTAPLDLNTASATDLDSLPGVGPATAAAILSYRQHHGPFRRIDDLADVPGIGPAKLAQIRPHVHL